ncbi:UNVERIFIED_CONTAM: hypothetical protein FKN15_018655 [Acipenser sinensis]
MYSEESSCSKNPECSWCGGGCRSYQPDSGCGSAGCLGLARFLSDCQSCLVFSGRSDSLPQAPGEFGWCVQNETCIPVTGESVCVCVCASLTVSVCVSLPPSLPDCVPVSLPDESSSCRVDQISRAYGWWGEKTRFITSLEDCQRDNHAPGIHLLTFQNPRNDSQPDKVSIVRSTSITLNPSTEMDVTLAFKGFIHPLWSSPGPGDVVSVWARVQRLYVAARIGKGPNTVEPNLERGNKYAVQIEGYLNNSGNGQTSELTLTWNRTGVPGGSEISFLFLEPFLSGSCSRYPSCLACLADQGCGWCSHRSSCLPRIDPARSSTTTQCAGGELQLILTPGNCDPYCEWQISSNKKGDFLCSRRGRVEGSIRNAESCPTQCNQRRSCGECLSNSSQCAWCQSAQSCFFFASYLTKFPFGECRDWYDSVHSAPQCLDCSQHTSCQDCLRSFECGWCLHGGYSGLRDPAGFPNCSAAVSASHPSLPPWEPALWSYRSCPDVDECRLGSHVCHPSASCHNTPDSYQCHCHRGYTGDGVQHCNRTCYNECVHGQCSGPPDYLCQCELGWTSNSSAVEQSGVECELDCGCNFHSTCETGLGVCDHCQDWTQGERCELCRPGSFGSAVERGGCSQCSCNGHGLEELGFCEGSGGVCHCGDATEGQHCEKCSLLLPPVAGHTLTVRRGRSLLLIGGYSPEHGFNNKLLEFNLETGNWSAGLQTGTPPTGLYGHSVVYHEGTDALFLFGGYRFHVGSVAPSAELYSLFYPNLTWSLLAPSQGKKGWRGGEAELERERGRAGEGERQGWRGSEAGLERERGRAGEGERQSWRGSEAELERGRGRAGEGARRAGEGERQSWRGSEAELERGRGRAGEGARQGWRGSEAELERGRGRAGEGARQSWRGGEAELERGRGRAGEGERQGWRGGHSLLNVSPMPVESSPPRPCPTPCHQHSSCRECLGSKGADGGWRRCLWSLSLSQCVSPSFLPLLCVAGRCGRVLNGSESCSPECSRLQQCSSCIRQPSCGWCAARGLNGAGQCLQGGLWGAQQGESGGTCTESNGTWAFLSCPPENECLNGHHDCNATQNCNDKLQGYECPCKSGYTLHNPVLQPGVTAGGCTTTGAITGGGGETMGYAIAAETADRGERNGGRGQSGGSSQGRIQ